MNNLLQRMPQSAKVGLVAALLVALVGSLYYFAIVRPNQIAQQSITPAPEPVASNPTPAQPAQPTTAQPSTPTPTPDAQASAPTRSLEVVPLPFLVTEAAQPETTATATTAPKTAVAAKPESDIPPNPFVPLVVEQETPTTPTTGTTASARPTPGIIANPTPTITRPSAVVASNPIPSQTAKVRVTQPTRALPGLPNLPTATPTQTTAQTKPTQTKPTQTSSKPSSTQAQDLVKSGGQARLAPGGGRGTVPGVLSLGAGALPIRLTPLERELVKATPTPTQTDQEPEQITPADPALDTSVAGGNSNPPDFARVDTKAPATQTLEPRTKPATTPPAPTPVQPTPVAIPANPVTEYIQAQNLKLANVVLGSTNIAIFQSREGYMVVPVGNTLPGSSILLKSLNTKEALLVQGSQEQNLSIENP